ncbi:MAG: hypothetical protein JW702_05890 [Clostridiales bacterium]|nr:hypothetical protein [Clostridiales bacterium]
MLFITLALIGYKAKLDKENRQETLEELAITISESVYLGQRNNIENISTETALAEIDMSMEKVKGINIKSVQLQSYSDEYKKEKSVTVVSKIIENPFKTSIFHRMKFVELDNVWILYDFTAESN